MRSIAATFTAQPFAQFRKNRYFYLWYDGFYAVLCLAAVAVMHTTEHQPLIKSWDNRFWLLLPFVCYAQILTSVFIHNATHRSFPRAINRLVGELCGIVVLTRFASWEIIHQRHHRYSDDVDLDPHPIVPNFFAFMKNTIINVEVQLQRIYTDVYGDTPETRRYEKMRAYVSYGTNLLLIYTWFLFLGPIAFFFFFVISSLVGFVHLVHFNWSTHNAMSPDRDYKPVNLNEGLFKIGNKLCFGIYMHANHHRRVSLFNPAKMNMDLETRRGARRIAE